MEVQNILIPHRKIQRLINQLQVRSAVLRIKFNVSTSHRSLSESPVTTEIERVLLNGDRSKRREKLEEGGSMAPRIPEAPVID